MNVKFDHDFFKQLKKLDIKIRKSFRERIAIYEEMTAGEDIIAYFVILGTHKQLYKKNKKLLDS